MPTAIRVASTPVVKQPSPPLPVRDRAGAREQIGRAVRRAEARARRADAAPLPDRVAVLREGIHEVYALLRENRALDDRDELIQVLAFVDWTLSLAAEADDLGSFRSACFDLVQLAWALEKP